MKILLTLLSLSFIYQTDTNPDSDPHAVATITKVSDKYSLYKTLKIEFTYKQVDIESKHTDEQSGTIFLKKGLDKYKIENEKLEIFADKSIIQTRIKDQNEVYINTIDENFKTLNPFDLINIQAQSKNYKVIDESKPNDSNYTITIFVLKNSPFFKIQFIIDKKHYTIKKINFSDKSGFQYEYSILKESHNINLPDDYFYFNKTQYPDIEIIDYRLLNK
ncbi:MAG: LolA family protein [Solitalea-like symbiont of Acarus siro]